MANQRKNISRVCIAYCIVSCPVLLAAVYYKSVLFWLVSSTTFLGLVAVTLLAIGFTTLRTSITCVFALAFALSLWATEWPLHAVFYFARPKLEQLETEFNETGRIPRDCIAGLLHISRIEVNDDDLCFWTTYQFDRCGFVKRSGRSHDYGRLSLDVDLGESWYYLWDD